LSRVWLGVSVYFGYVSHLLLPGRRVPSYFEEQHFQASLPNWPDADLQLLIDEGRRQADSQGATLLEVRGRAQWLFTGALAVVTALAAAASVVLTSPCLTWEKVLWFVSISIVGYAALGAAAVITVRGDFGAILASELSTRKPPLLPSVAKDYAEMLEIGDNTVNTIISVYRQAVVWLLLGSTCGLISWVGVKA